MYTFETPSAPTLWVRAGGGNVTVTAEDTQRTTVELTPLNAAGEDVVAGARVEQSHGTVTVELPRHRGGLFGRQPSVAVEITCPSGTTLEVKSESADVLATGTYATAVLSSGSGDVSVDQVTGSAKLKSGSGTVSAGRVGKGLVVSTGSGDVNVEESAHTATVSVGSGDIRIGQVTGDAVTKTGSGDVEVGRLDGTLMTKSGSGDLVVRRATSGAVKANGASGDITIGIDSGTAAWLDVSSLTGRISQELEESGAPSDGQQRVEITAHTVSGDLRVHRS